MAGLLARPPRKWPGVLTEDRTLPLASFLHGPPWPPNLTTTTFPLGKCPAMHGPALACK